MLEVDAKGDLVDITASLLMANTSGFDAHEALKAAQFQCKLCSAVGSGCSRFMLINAEKEHEYWCRQCYSDSCKDDPLDPRACRKRDNEREDKELSSNQWRRDKAENEGKPRNTAKSQKAAA